MKTLILEPIVPSEMAWGSFSAEKGFIPPIGLLYLYQYLRAKGYMVDFLDSQFMGPNSYGTLKDILVRENYDLIGIPVLTSTAICSFSTAEFCRRVLPKAKIVFGNVHATALSERTLTECSAVDYIIRGEGELAMSELIDCLKSADFSALERIMGLVYRQENGKIRINADRPLIDDLGQLPMNIYKGLDATRYIPHPGNYRRLPSVSIITQRGCPFQCLFCDAHVVHGRKTRFIPVELVIEQIKYLVKTHRIKEVYFQDSTFTVNRNYTQTLLQRIIREKFDLTWACNTRVDCIDPELLRLMKDSGCWQISFGIESGNDETLRFLQKGAKVTVDMTREVIHQTRKAGISVFSTFILGLPNEDEAMVRKTINFAKKLRPHNAQFYLPVPFPGTRLYQVCQETGGLREDASWKDYLCVDYNNPVYINPKLGLEKMKYYYNRAWREFYFNPIVWWDNLLQIKSFDDLCRYTRGFIALLGFFSQAFVRPIFVFIKGCRFRKSFNH